MKTEDERCDTTRQIPWWVYLTFAILAYPMLYYIIPLLGQKGNLPLLLIPMARQAAPIITIIFLLLAANALYKNEPPTTSTTPENQKEDN
jgi:predicted membrane metal-binding protein